MDRQHDMLMAGLVAAALFAALHLMPAAPADVEPRVAHLLAAAAIPDDIGTTDLSLFLSP